METSTTVDRDSATPFLLKLFYRTGAFHRFVDPMMFAPKFHIITKLTLMAHLRRLDEFSSPSYLPLHLPIHTWPTCTLTELSHHLAAASPPVLPDPAIGTRLVFRLIYADARAGAPNAPARFVSKDLGSLVIGHGGPGTAPDDAATAEEEEGKEKTTTVDDDDDDDGGAAANKTLADAKFVVGDYISCAIMPPLEDTGAVAPAAGARPGRGSGVGEAPARGPPVVPLARGPRADGGRASFGAGDPWGGGGRGRGFGGGGGGGRGPRHFGDRERERERDRDRDRDFGYPTGEWRRGERLPDAPPSRGRGRGSRW